MSEQELPGECCAKCRFFHHVEISKYACVMECRRRSPVVFPPRLDVAAFPPVRPNDWCGEFQPRQESPA